jgi:hypothetical protein
VFFKIPEKVRGMINKSVKNNVWNFNFKDGHHFKKYKANHLLPDKNRMVFLSVN